MKGMGVQMNAMAPMKTCRGGGVASSQGKVFCAKPTEVNPISLDFCMTNKCFDSTHIINYGILNSSGLGHRS